MSRETDANDLFIAKGILKALGVPCASATGKIYRVQVGAYKHRENAEAMQQKLKAAGYAAIITEVK